MISYLSIFVLIIIARFVHCNDNSFYITNVAVIRQCTTEKPLFLQLFDSKQMSCLGKTWRHISANIEYACEQNQLKHFWTLQTKLNPSVAWPKKVHLFTVYEKTHVYTLHSISLTREKETMEESARPFNPAQNAFVTYVWVQTTGPYCRLKYTIIKDICTAKKGQRVGMKGLVRREMPEWQTRMPPLCLVNEFVCDYGKKDYFLVNVKDRDALSKFIDDTIKTSSSSSGTSKNSTTGNGSQQTLNGGSPDPSAVAQKSESKLKTIIIVAGIAIIVGGILAVILVLFCRKSGPEKNAEQRMSIESTGDL